MAAFYNHAIGGEIDNLLAPTLDFAPPTIKCRSAVNKISPLAIWCSAATLLFLS
ncbi:hypothetical protein BABINDRAFT_159484 [Babjeviella inositovora NRRL Y-12698]|uniref:Uncharacterized protein n=1 Tax=Babjeviella inositovora NRRL Y-12698 TaxID=984486 RepID=A0A1E3QZD9_9ASCO|nr:uncharacterized protein BABINDRAFT_159484 [Babjeviella inositovora NRRL Y-12698]ODQ83006.1 hypothetical protein BABINDRAFT_159484 [Babjeviella inositovora NRRL Y-12698]